MSVWDDPEIRSGGEFVKFEQVGDEVSGTIAAVRAHRFDDGKVAPQIILTTDGGEERTVTCSQVRLKQELAEQRPEAGDWIHIKLMQVEPRAGGKSLKHWQVEIRRGGGGDQAAAPSQPDSPAPQPAAQPAAAPAGDQAVQLSPEQAAAIAQLSPEQRQQLGL